LVRYNEFAHITLTKSGTTSKVEKDMQEKVSYSLVSAKTVHP
jgi:hypothetical protein